MYSDYYLLYRFMSGSTILLADLSRFRRFHFNSAKDTKKAKLAENKK
uniref:Uncharacterized protein n=1 Tax=Loigolactobacillus rennini TaxID=238013 RepID=A0A1K2I3C4_9LACO|nr:hypothetical protein LREN565_0003 [Loigolactobacillus rennini]